MMINGKELSEPEVKAYIKELEADKMAALLLLRDAIGILNDGSCSKDCSKCERRNNGCDYNVRFKWKHTDESLKLLRQLESK